MAEKVMVVGSNSFSGSHFVAHCLEQGLGVVGISRSPELDECFLPYRWQSAGDYQFHQLDLNHHLPQIMDIVQAFQPDYVVNFAAQGMVAQSWGSPRDWLMTNTVAMVDFHDQLRHCRFLKKFVQASTPEVYGNTADIIREDAPFNPSTPYAISKAACDMSLLAFAKAYDFPVAFTRAANVCGPGQQLYRIIPRAFLSCLTGEKMRLDGGGTSTRAFIDIRDVCEITLRIAREAQTGQIFHLSSQEWVSIRALVERICHLCGADFSRLVEIGPPRLAQDAAYTLDSTLVQQQFDWRPARSLQTTLADTHSWMRNYLGPLQGQTRDYVHKP